jgi:heterodisulfide reductase subunit C
LREGYARTQTPHFTFYKGMNVTISLASEVNRLSSQQTELCYHCHKCTAGCPVIGAMTYGPDQILRMAALDQRELLFSSRDIWLCAGCYACATRCPNGIDIASVMDALRQLSLSEGYPAAEGDVFLFHRLFLGVLKQFGRSHEAFTLGLFKARSHQPLVNDMGAGLGLFLRGKIPLLPKRSGAEAPVRKIFKESE